MAGKASVCRSPRGNRPLILALYSWDPVRARGCTSPHVLSATGSASNRSGNRFGKRLWRAHGLGLRLNAKSFSQPTRDRSRNALSKAQRLRWLGIARLVTWRRLRWRRARRWSVSAIGDPNFFSADFFLDDCPTSVSVDDVPYGVMRRTGKGIDAASDKLAFALDPIGRRGLYRKTIRYS
jgi:hypothetical protein